MAWERSALTLILVFIQSILIGLKLDHAIHSSWWVVFTPAYVWVGIIVLLVLISWYNLNNTEIRETWMSPKRTIYFAVVASCTLALVILISLKAENGSPPWPVVFIPIYVYLLLLLIVIIFYGSDDPEIIHTEIHWIWLQWYWLLNLFTWGVLLFIFLAIKLSGSFAPWNYWAVLAPLWVLAVTAALLLISSIPFIVNKKIDADVWKMCIGVAAYAVTVLFLLFLTLRADKTIVWKWSIVFIPLYVLEVIAFIYVAIEWLLEPSIKISNYHVNDEF